MSRKSGNRFSEKDMRQANEPGAHPDSGCALRVGEAGQSARASLLPGAAALALATLYLIALLAAERQLLIIGLLAIGIVAVLAANWLGWLVPVGRSFADREDGLGGLAIAAAILVAAFFHYSHFVLLLVVTVLLYIVATLGLNIQFGYAGVLNFAGASFFGIGAYTSAVLNAHTGVPHLLVLPIGGRPEFRIGRSDDNELVLLDPAVSRYHAAIRPSDQGYVIFDLDSSNGVRVNGEAVRFARLADGDEIQVGSTLAHFRDGIAREAVEGGAA